MAASAWVFHDRFKEYMGDNTIDMDNDTFVMKLYTSASNITSASLGDATTATNEVSGNGYSPDTLAVTWVRSGGTVTFDSDDGVFTASGGTLTCRYAAIIDTTTTPDEIVCHCVLDTVDVSVTNGNTLTVQINAAGIGTLT
jgi:hypothetical protein